MAWASGAGRAEMGLRLGTALWRFWQMRGYLDEGMDRLKAVLAMPECADYAQERLAALDAAGGLAYWRGDTMTARTYYAEALEARRALGDPRAIAESLYNLSFSYTFEREGDAARPLIKEAIDLFEAAGDATGVAKSRWALGNVEYSQGRSREARAQAMPALATFEAVGDAFMIGWTGYGVGLADLLEGDWPEARRRFHNALAIFAESADVSGYTLVLDSIAGLAFREGDRQRAARIAGAVATLERTTGTGLNTVNRDFARYDPTPLKTDPETAAAYAEGERMDVDAIVAYALEGTAAPESKGPMPPAKGPTAARREGSG
jgi:tetratricopeptide (TPR) repeat protein